MFVFCLFVVLVDASQLRKQLYLFTTAFSDWTRNVGEGFSQVYDDYSYFPIFLLVGHISFTASRWREFMLNCHTLQGCVHDIGNLCGGCLTKTATLAHLKQLYIIYRYVNAIHAMTYNSVSPSLSALDLDDYCTKLGLLTEDEVDKLFPYDNKMREIPSYKLENRLKVQPL
jgi:hypothetical protein